MGLRVEQIDVAAGGKLELTWNLTRNGAIMPLTGWSAKMQIRQNKRTATVLADFSTNSGGYMTISELAGVVMLDVPGSVTGAFDFNSAVYDMYVVDPSGEPFRVVEGTVIVSATVTR